jgi:hypothetical protein
MPKSNRTPSRRDFLKYSATASIGLGCMSLGLTEAIAQKKPVFSEQTLNAALRAGGRGNKIEAQKNLAAEIRRDPKGWVQSHFNLTPNQRAGLDSYDAEDYGKIDKILEMVEKNGGTMSAHFSNSAKPNRQTQISQRDCPNKGGGRTLSFQVRTPAGNGTADLN